VESPTGGFRSASTGTRHPPFAADPAPRLVIVGFRLSLSTRHDETTPVLPVRGYAASLSDWGFCVLSSKRTLTFFETPASCMVMP